MPKIVSLEDLHTIKESAKVEFAARAEGKTRIVVGLGTCGIAAGARDILHALMEELQKNSPAEVTIETTGCAGTCRLEPIVSVIRDGAVPVVYVNVKPSDAARIVSGHIVNGQVVQDLIAV